MSDEEPGFAALRQRAEKMLHRRETNLADGDCRTLGELLHELEVYSVELELQNEELKGTRDALEVAKDRYRNLYDFAPVAYYTLSTEGLIREVNLAGAMLLGLERGRLIGRAFLQYVAARDQGRVAELLRRAASGPGADAQKLELALRHNGAHQVYVLAELVGANSDEDGAGRELRLVLTDISEHKRLEDQRNMFFSIASHELRTPVTNICLSLDLLLKNAAGALDPELRNTLEMTRRGALRLKKLTEDILRLRDSREGSATLVARPVDLVPLVDEAVTLNRPFARRLGVPVEVGRLPPQALVMADEDRLIQVLTNLLTNAVKHSQPGMPVRVTVEPREALFRVSVTDRGPGLDETLRERVFQPFTQSQPSLEDERHRGSTGLGLSIGRAIIRQLGGRMDFNSRPGEGAVFYFELPRFGL